MKEKLWVRGIATGLSCLVPILLILVSVRVVMTKPYLHFMYTRPHFAEDYLYDWDKQVRLDYGYYGIRYLLSDKDIDYLGDLVIHGKPAFEADELRHMEDVKVITQAAMRILQISLVLFVFGTITLLYRIETHPIWLRAMSRGGISTLIIIAMLMVVALVSWDFFFDTFHALFFEEGTWQFSNTDALIRLYPPPFWYYSAFVVAFLAVGGALLCTFVPRWWLHRRFLHPVESPPQAGKELEPLA